MYLAREDTATADVYMLYDDMGYIPRWVFTLGLYPVSRAATARWGIGRVAVVALTESTLEQALQNGRLIYIASHGADGYIMLTGELPYWPQDMAQMAIGPDLQYVYMAGCDTGFLHTAWEKAFAPAYVKTFNRLSSMSEHILWLLFEGPSVVSVLE